MNNICGQQLSITDDHYFNKDVAEINFMEPYLTGDKSFWF